jgi:hypothetical protein
MPNLKQRILIHNTLPYRISKKKILFNNIYPSWWLVKYCPPTQGSTENWLFQYEPTLEGNTGSNYKDSKKIFTVRIRTQLYSPLPSGVPSGFVLRNSFIQRVIFDWISLLSSYVGYCRHVVPKKWVKLMHDSTRFASLEGLHFPLVQCEGWHFPLAKRGSSHVRNRHFEGFFSSYVELILPLRTVWQLLQ